MIDSKRIDEVRAAIESAPVYQPATDPNGLPHDDLSLTDAGNAKLFAKLNRHAARFDHVADRWLVYTGKRWEFDSTGEVVRMAKGVAFVLADAAKAQPPQVATKLLKQATKSLSGPRLAAMLKLAQSELPLMPGELDADPWAFNCANGTLNLRTCELRPHRAEDMISQLSPVEWQPNRRSEDFEKFVHRIFDGDIALIDFVQRLLGYCLSGDVSAQVMPVCHGGGANGKSTLLDAVLHTMGDYGCPAPPDLLMQRTGNEHPTEVAGLRGKRLVVASETEKNRKLKVQTMKRLTGEAQLTARLMFGDFFTFNRTFKLVMQTNNRPAIEEDSEAVWRRLKLVPFNVTIPPEERDPKLLDRLKGEAPAILAWLVEGFQKWQAHGLTEPSIVTDATEGYRADSDPLAVFIADCCVVAPDAWTLSSQLRETYERHCRENGVPVLDGRELEDALKRHKLEPLRRHAGRGWSGIGLRTNDTVTRDVT